MRVRVRTTIGQPVAHIHVDDDEFQRLQTIKALIRATCTCTNTQNKTMPYQLDHQKLMVCEKMGVRMY